DDAERAQAAREPGLEVAEVGRDRLGAFEVQDRARAAAADAALEICDGADELEVALGQGRQLARAPRPAGERQRPPQGAPGAAGRAATPTARVVKPRPRAEARVQ